MQFLLETQTVLTRLRQEGEALASQRTLAPCRKAKGDYVTGAMSQGGILEE